MAIDQTVMNEIKDKKSDPVIRFYKWYPDAVSIGRFQKMQDEVNLESCKKLGVDYVRRITGGGAVYHDNKGEITYSVIAKESEFKKGVIETYKEVSAWIINGLNNLGISAEFAPINDIVVKGKKISGNAQTRELGVVLQHGTILYQLDIKRMFSLLNVSKEKISDKMIKNAEDRVTCVKNFVDVSQDQLYFALKKSFLEEKEYYISNWSDEEKENSQKIAESVYKTSKWNGL
jgi:lipoate-protein ligase A